ncbi:MAG: hypothetical protein J6U12_03340 [Candidatus Methanomethylophilaceae archaeon]|nr:hypothetical protein [Candidatus Methanomethylophilaceae archaeon]MBP5685817.1 hypothetical protein [Candidatus Methanomethylophilaceae archaeon]MBP5735160.1 hypothetical protein [Candidatus Methanomethylophilaceae archaeon]
MASDNSEEFRQFILENREIIEKILSEDDKKKGKKSKKIPHAEKLDEKVEDTKAKAKNLNDTILKIVSDDEVQQHFITGCLEFVHFLEAVIEAVPMSSETREVVTKFEDARDTTIRNVVAVGAKDKMENIEVKEVKKTRSSKSTSKAKPESIKINVKKS